MLAETASEMWTDAILLPFVKASYRKAARALRPTGMGIFIKESSAISVTTGVSALSRSGGGATYPSDLVRPLRLRERKATTGTYTDMSNSDGFLPTSDPTKKLLEAWDWRNDQIVFPAALEDKEVIIQYEAELAALSGTSSVILIPDALDPLAKMVASMGARSRDEVTHAQELWAQAVEDLAQIAQAEERVKKARGAPWGKK